MLSKKLLLIALIVATACVAMVLSKRPPFPQHPRHHQEEASEEEFYLVGRKTPSAPAASRRFVPDRRRQAAAAAAEKEKEEEQVAANKLNVNGLFMIGQRGLPMSAPRHISNQYLATTLSDSENPFGCVKVYGKYCGPGWCGNDWFHGCNGTPSNKKCDFNVQPINQVDACCKVHDKCCIGGNCSTQGCDEALEKCLEKAQCDKSDYACKIARSTMKGFFGARNDAGNACC